MLSKALVLVRIAARNIISSVLNLFVGAVLLFGAALLVVGGSLFSTLDGALSRSVVDSITGHLQVYGARSKDPLEIYGKPDGSDSNLAPLDDFPSLKAKLLQLPNVARVVPMGAATGQVTTGNAVDLTLEKLRALYRDGRGALSPAEFTDQATALKAHVRNIIALLTSDSQRSRELVEESAIDARGEQALATASSEAFWADFDAAPFEHLELLENRIAPLVADGDLLFLRYLGTDLEAYQESFGRMQLVEGTAVPKGHRGVLLPRFFSEEYLKLKNARRLDKIRDARAAGRRLADLEDKELQRFVHENQAQTRELVLQLDARGTATARAALQGLLHSQEEGLEPLLQQLFTVTDENFEERYQFFYAQLAPLLSLYRVRVGDPITLKSFGRSGALETATVKVYGIFELQGLEKSPLAGANALLDIVTFRDLYGFLTAEKQAELEAMQAASPVKQVARESAEADLFGAGAGEVEAARAQAFEEPTFTRTPQQERARAARQAATYAPEEVDRGVVLHAAVLLREGSPQAQAEALAAIERELGQERAPVSREALAAAKALAARGGLPFVLSSALEEVLTLEEARARGTLLPASAPLLGLAAALKGERAGLPAADVATLEALLAAARPKAWVVGWSTAAGFLGKFIEFFRVLLVAVIVIFTLVALVVVTIGMTIATLQRTPTIGMLRAIGAQRTFIMAMVLVETVVLALTFGGAGAALGAAVVKQLHARGIPAFRDELYFFFSGPVLRPELTLGGVGLAVGLTVVVSVLAVVLPTVLAMRVAPVTAMQAAE